MTPRYPPARVVATRPMMRRKRRRRALAVLTVTLALIIGGSYGAWRYIDENEYLLDERCEVLVGDQEHRLTPQQAHQAALLSAVAVDLGLPPGAATHAVAMSLQETDLGLRADDEDPLQRQLFAAGAPDWNEGARAEQVPVTVGGFYNRLEEFYEAGLEDEDAEDSDEEESEDAEEEEQEPFWEPAMPLDEAAELLNRPHNSQFYTRHYDLARAFAGPLTGQQPVDMTCELSQLEGPGPDAEAAAAELIATLPHALEIPFTEEDDNGDDDDAADDDDEEFVPQPLAEGIVDVSGSGEDAVVTVTVPSSEEGYDYQWLVAHWAVAAAESFGIQTVAAGPFQWDRDSGQWQRQDELTADGTVILGFTRD